MPNLEIDLDCFCPPGVGSGCSFCRPAEDDHHEQPEEMSYTSSSWHGKASSRTEPSTYTIKVKRVEKVTNAATLVVTKKGCLWIPLAMIYEGSVTKKGNYKIKVYSTFEPTYIDVPHSHFKNPSEE